MSVIIAIKDKKRHCIVCGCDSQVTCGNTKRKLTGEATKLWKHNELPFLIVGGVGSLRDIQLKYKILSPETLRKWILKYNNDIILTDYKPMSEVYTMKSRKVSYEERIEIVNYCIANNYDYKGTADKYNVPYYQVYTWVKKVKENGHESLKLQKKGPKSKYLVEPQTNEELLQLEIERLRREKERLELEVEVLKKKHRLQKRADIRK